MNALRHFQRHRLNSGFKSGNDLQVLQIESGMTFIIVKNKKFWLLILNFKLWTSKLELLYKVRILNDKVFSDSPDKKRFSSIEKRYSTDSDTTSTSNGTVKLYRQKQHTYNSDLVQKSAFSDWKTI